MRRLTVCLLAVALAGGLVLAGCHQSPQAPAQKTSSQPDPAAATSTPQAAVTSVIGQLKAGQFNTLAQQALPPAVYQQLRSQWSARQQRALQKVTDADRKRFAKNMRELTAPDAKQKEWEKLQPMLKAWDTKYKKRLPMIVGMVRIAIGSEITQSDTMSGDQKSQARGVLSALSDWALNTNWGDKAKAKTALGIVVDTARALDLKTLEQAYQLSYEQTMQRYGTAWNGFKQVLAVYGLSVDKILDSATIKTIAHQGDTATVQVDYRILGKPMTSTIDMVRKGKRWYMRDALKHWRKQQARLAPAASVAPAASAPAPAATVR